MSWSTFYSQRLFPVLLFLVSAQPAWACPVCFSANGKALHAYWLVTGLLTLLPPALLYGLYRWWQKS